MKSKFPTEVYVALRAMGMNNRDAARALGVSEAAVRRGLKDADEHGSSNPRRREFRVIVEEV